MTKITTDDILKGAVNLYANSGFENFSIRKLGSHINISHSVIYHYYENESKLLKAMFEYASRELGRKRRDLPQPKDAVQMLPEIPNNIVTWTDGFGNVKTSMRQSDLEKMGLTPGDKVQVIMNGVSMLGVLSIGGFQVDRGVLAINAGSSGYDNPFIELFLRVHKMSEKTAAVRFGYPSGGTEFEIKPS